MNQHDSVAIFSDHDEQHIDQQAQENSMILVSVITNPRLKSALFMAHVWLSEGDIRYSLA